MLEHKQQRKCILNRKIQNCKVLTSIQRGERFYLFNFQIPIEHWTKHPLDKSVPSKTAIKYYTGQGFGLELQPIVNQRSSLHHFTTYSYQPSTPKDCFRGENKRKEHYKCCFEAKAEYKPRKYTNKNMQLSAEKQTQPLKPNIKL